MNNLYLIEGNQEVLINKEIDKIIKKHKDIDIIKFNLEESSIDNVIETLDTYDMFGRTKVVIASNPLFLVNLVDNFNINSFLKYLNNPSNNILIIITDKINNRLKVVKDIINYFNYIKISDVNFYNFIKDNIDDYKMDNMTINYLVNIIGSNINEILNELNKLKEFKLEEKVITKNDINLICKKNFENTIFDLIDAIIKKEKEKVIDLYNYFINNGTEVFGILILLSNQIRLIYNVKVLSRLSDMEIAKILDVKEYPVKLARGKGVNYQKKELLSILYNLGKIDENIKNGKEIPNISLLSYILEI